MARANTSSARATARAHAARRRRGHHHRGANQRAGLARVHFVDFGQRRVAGRGREVERLAARHARRAAGGGEQLTSSGGRARRRAVRAARRAPRTPAPAARRRRGSRSLRRTPCARRPAAAQVVVVHRRQVVVHQRIGVDQLDRAGRRVDARFGIRARSPSRRRAAAACACRRRARRSAAPRADASGARLARRQASSRARARHAIANFERGPGSRLARRSRPTAAVALIRRPARRARLGLIRSAELAQQDLDFLLRLLERVLADARQPMPRSNCVSASSSEARRARARSTVGLEFRERLLEIGRRGRSASLWAVSWSPGGASQGGVARQAACAHPRGQSHAAAELRTATGR